MYISSMYYPSAFGGPYVSSNLSFFGAPFEKKHRPGRINPGLTDKSLELPLVVFSTINLVPGKHPPKT